MNEILNEPSWGKAQSIIQERFNKNIEYRFIDLLKSDDNTTSVRAFIRNDDLVINLSYQKVRLGHLIIQRGALLKESDRADIIDLVDFMLTPVIYNLYLKNMEKSILIEKAEMTERSPNIIPLQQHQYNEYESRSEIYTIDNIISKFLHLKASQSMQRKKVALKIHEMLGNNFFLDYSQISKNILDASELQDLDKTTIYVDDLAQLERKDLVFLNSFIEKQDQLSLLMLVGSSMTDSKIHQLNTTDALKNDLVGFSFEIDKVPVEMQISEEVLEIMFFDTNTGYSN